MSRLQPILRAALAAALLAALPARAIAPQVMTYSGYLKSSGGAPVTTATNITFRLYAGSTGGPAVWTEMVSVTPTGDGWFSAVIGTTSPLPFSVLSQDLYLSLQVGGDAEFTQRARVTPSHAALTVDWGGVQGKPSCTPGAFLTLDGVTGSLLCQTPAAGSAGVTTVSATTPVNASITGNSLSIGLIACGLGPKILQWDGNTWACTAPATGGVTSVTTIGTTPITAVNTGGAVQLSMNPASGSANGYLASADFTTFNNKLTPPAGCTLGQVIKWTPSGWGCAVDDNSGGTLTNVTVSGGALGASGTTIRDISLGAASATSSGYVTAADWNAFSNKISPPASACGASEKLTWTGSGAACASDANTTYSAGAGLTLSGTQFTPTFTASGGNSGTATTVARGDHAHAPLATVQLRPPDFQTESTYTPLATLGRVSLDGNGFTWRSVAAWTLGAGAALTATVQVPGGVTSANAVTAQLTVAGQYPTAASTDLFFGLMPISAPGTGVTNTWSDSRTTGAQTFPAGGTQTVTFTGVQTYSYRAGGASPVVSGDVIVIFLQNAATSSGPFHLLGLQLIFN